MARIEFPSGSVWYYNELNQYHREDGPAVDSFFYKAWYRNGLCHRLDGPAEEYTDGRKSYYIINKHYYYEDWLTIKNFPLLW